MEIIQVSDTSPTSAVAGAIVGVVREYRCAELQAVGTGAVNQALEALIQAIGCLKQEGIFVACVPEHAEVVINNERKTLTRFMIAPGAVSSLFPIVFSANSGGMDLPRV